MVKLNEILDFLKEMAPESLAESYDNVGLLLDREGECVENVVLTLDTDCAVIDEAKAKNAELIISHHPLIFNPVKRVTEESEIGRSIKRLVKNNIALFAMHTNFDSVKNGLCDFLAEKIFGKSDFLNFLGEDESGIGRVLELDEEMFFSEICSKAKNALKLDYLRVVGEDDKKIKKIAIVGGGGGSMTVDALKLGADCYISGDFKYQHGRDAANSGLSLIEITHYDAEIIFGEYVKKLLKDKFGDKICVHISCENTNVWRTV